MKLQTKSIVSYLFFFLPLVPAFAQTASSIDFVTPVYAGTSVTVKGTINDTLSISVASGAPDCSKFGQPPLVAQQIKDPAGAAGGVTSIKLDVSPKTITLVNPMNTGDQVCLRLDHTLAASTTSVYSSAVTVTAATGTLRFSAPPSAASKLISVAMGVPSATPADVFVYGFPSGYPTPSPPGFCSITDLNSKKGIPLSIGATQETSQSLQDNTPQTISLYKPLNPGDQICLVAYYKAPLVGAAAPPAPPAFSLMTRVAPLPAGIIKFTTDVIAGIGTFSFQSDTAGDVTIYTFGAGFKGKNGDTCSDDDRENGTPVTMVGNSTNATVTSVSVLANVQQTVSLTTPPNAGTKLCLYESTGAGIVNSAFSAFKQVNYFAPGSDYGRFTIDFVGGAMVSNQQQSTNSSTASQYLDVSFGYTFMRSGSTQKTPYRPTKHRGPGLQSFLDARLASIPVTSVNNNIQTSLPTMTGSAIPQDTASTPTLTQSLNALSSQQSIRVLGGFYAPFRLTRWYGNSNWLTLAPLAVAGFDTLLNPTAPSAPASSSVVINTTTANFSSVYNYRAAGARLGWDVYPDSTDEAPRDLAWISATLGNYSNLPAYVCTAKAQDSSIPTGAKSFSDTAAPQTDCLISPTPTSTSTGPYTVYASRKLIPRIDVAGELMLPSLPIVMGIDANLSQFWIDGNHLDTQNRPGNDVRIYLGLKLDITKALAKFGVANPAQ